jgi:hypothetical protein
MRGGQSQEDRVKGLLFVLSQNYTATLLYKAAGFARMPTESNEK